MGLCFAVFGLVESVPVCVPACLLKVRQCQRTGQVRVRWLSLARPNRRLDRVRQRPIGGSGIATNHDVLARGAPGHSRRLFNFLSFDDCPGCPRRKYRFMDLRRLEGYCSRAGFLCSHSLLL